MKSLVVLSLAICIEVPMVHGNINCPSNKVIIKPFSTDGPLAVNPARDSLVGPKKGSDPDLYTWHVAKKGSNKYAFKNLKNGKWLRAYDWQRGWAFNTGPGAWSVFADKEGYTKDLGSWEYFTYVGDACPKHAGGDKYAGTFALKTAHGYYFEITQRKQKQDSWKDVKIWNTYQDQWRCVDRTRFTFECVE